MLWNQINIICVNTHECHYNHSFIVYFTNTMSVCFDPRFKLLNAWAWLKVMEEDYTRGEKVEIH